MSRGSQPWRRPLSKGDALLLATTLVWGMSFPFGKIVLAVVPPLGYASSRFLLAGFVLFTVLRVRRVPLAIARRDVARLLLTALVGYTAFQGVWSVGLSHTTAAKGAILISTSPIFAALIATALGHRPRALAWLGIALSFAGVFLLMNNSLDRLTLAGGTWIGDAMFLGAAVLWACYTFLAPPLLAEYGALKTTAYAMCIGAGLLFLGGGPALVTDLDWSAVGPSIIGAYAFTALIGGALGFLWWFDGLDRLGVARSIPYMYLVPLFGVIGATLLLGERLSPLQIAAGGIILFGIALTRRGTA